MAVREVWGYVIGWAVRNDPALADPPADWRRVIIRPPRAINVDIGRNTAAMLAELKAGTKTYAEIYAERGEDWRAALQQRAAEAAYIRDLAQQYRIAPENIAEFIELENLTEESDDEESRKPIPASRQ